MRRRKPERTSLEGLEEQAARSLVEREDEAVRFNDLIDAMAEKERVLPEGGPRQMGVREFVCASCHLVTPRSCLGDEERLLCRDCVGEASGRPVRAAGGRVRRRSVERPCPACGRILLVPEREDAACGFFCPGCGVHLRQRGGHLHMEWDHTYHSQLGPHPHLNGQSTTERPEKGGGS